MQRSKALKKAEQLITGDRAKDYGDAYQNHLRIAKMWSVILQKQITVDFGMASNKYNFFYASIHCFLNSIFY